MRYSEQTCYNQCPYKYKLSKIDNLRKIKEGSESNDRIWGQAIHAGLKCLYDKGDKAAIHAAFKAVYPKDLKPGDRVKSVDSGIATLNNYMDYYALMDKNWKVLATEVAGEIEIGGEEHGLHIDLIAENLQGGGIYFWDHKTSGKRPTSTNWQHYNLSAQLTRYADYVESTYGQCSGAYVNSITVGYRMRQYKGEPPGFWNHFERQLFNRTPDQIAFWRKSDEDWMKMIEFSKKENCWPKALNKLCSWCEFYELCVSNGDEQIRKLMYETEMGEVKIQ